MILNVDQNILQQCTFLQAANIAAGECDADPVDRRLVATNSFFTLEMSLTEKQNERL